MHPSEIELWKDLIREIKIIRWTEVCIAISLWGISFYFLLKEVPNWWHSFDKKGRNNHGKRQSKTKKREEET